MSLAGADPAAEVRVVRVALEILNDFATCLITEALSRSDEG